MIFVTDDMFKQLCIICKKVDTDKLFTNFYNVLARLHQDEIYPLSSASSELSFRDSLGVYVVLIMRLSNV